MFPFASNFKFVPPAEAEPILKAWERTQADLERRDAERRVITAPERQEAATVEIERQRARRARWEREQEAAAATPPAADPGAAMRALLVAYKPKERR